MTFEERFKMIMNDVVSLTHYDVWGMDTSQSEDFNSFAFPSGGDACGDKEKESYFGGR